MKELVQGTTNSPTTSQNQGNLELAGRIAIRMPKRRGSNHPPSPDGFGAPRRSEVGGQRTEFRISDCGFRIADFSIEDCVTVRHPGQVSQSGTRAGIQKKPDYIEFSLDSGSRPRSGLVRNDGFYGFYDLPFTAHRLPFTIYDLTN